MTTANTLATPNQHIVDRLDSVEIYDADDLAGYALAEIPLGRRAVPADAKPLTPVRCCRTCAWADAQHVSHIPGHGLAYEARHETGKRH
jgi:hypothetical protein